MSIISGANAVTGAGAVSYQIERSLRFNSADSAYLSRTFASAGNRQTWTWSAWVKRSSFVNNPQRLFYTGNSNDNETDIYLSGDRLTIEYYVAPTNYYLISSPKLRDPSAWYHLVVVVDTTNATSTDRMRLYINGLRVTNFDNTSYPAQNANLTINSAATHYIGQRSNGTNIFDGYLTEVNFIDGQALDPTSFGEYNSDTGVWQPIAYEGTYGTNGFYLNFSDNSGTTSTTLGKDYSGNGNNWTPNNFSVTAGAGNDSLVDTPTPYGTDTGAGGEVRGNYCTLNPTLGGSAGSFANGNLDATLSSTTGSAVFAGTMAMPTSGKYYFEYTVNTATGDVHSVGIVSAALVTKGTMSNDSNAEYATSVIYRSNGTIYKNTSSQGSFTSMSNGDIIGVAYSADAAEVKFYRNGTLITTVTGVTAVDYLPHAAKNPTGGSYSASFVFNAGQRPFAYTAPSGFKALCTQNLPEPTVVDGGEYFNPVLYNATDGVAGSVTGVGFAPDFVWVKSRSGANSHGLFDKVRGVEKGLFSNLTNAEISSNTYLTAFNSDGFSHGGAGLIANGSLVAWNWKANGTGVSNTDGTITSAVVSANPTAGFSVVTWSGTGVNGTVGHGLGNTPKLLITKNRTGTNGWNVWFDGYGADGYLILNSTDAKATYSGNWGSGTFNSTVFSVASGTWGNASGNNYVAYCFAPVAGYSAFGSYTGNGSTDGVFVYTGFAPRYILIKNASYAGTSWEIFDTARQDYNQNNLELLANSSAAEGSYTFGDILSNGFKLRSSNNGVNRSGDTLIYAAFASNPFRYSLAR